MCGIVGSFDYGRGAGRVTPGLIEAMGDAIAHRGPDGRGSFISTDARIGLGHRRLAIVDPEGGAQPMYGAGGVCVVFNGEIYNYPALRAELEADGARFATRCDTEVLLHLYERRGDAMVDALVGMFAFALWDPARERLLFARDPMGEKPLYWADTGGTLVFGSEIKALLEHPAVGRAVNAAAIPAYLAHLVTPSPHTLFDGIAKLPPGTMGVCDEGGVRLRRFATLPPTGSGPAPTPGEAAETVRALLGRSLDDRLMSDVPVGVLLSGGLDSTTLVALLAERGRSLATFSVGFDGSDLDEREEAAWVAKHFGTEHHEITVTEADAIGFLPKLIHHQDEPLADPVCVPLSFVCGLAREEGVKVVLAGEGADELFWGYPRYRQVLSQWPLMRALLGLPGPVRSVLPLAVPKRKAHLRELLEGLADGRPAALHSPLGLTGSSVRRSCATRPTPSPGRRPARPTPTRWPGWSPTPTPTSWACVCPSCCSCASTGSRWPTASRPGCRSWTRSWSATSPPSRWSTSCGPGSPRSSSARRSPTSSPAGSWPGPSRASGPRSWTGSRPGWAPCSARSWRRTPSVSGSTSPRCAPCWPGTPTGPGPPRSRSGRC